MSVQDTINYYANLLVIQYRGQPNAYANVQTVVTPVIMDMLPVTVQNAFTIDSAIGVQLDVLGKYAGVTRSGYGFTGPITLDDDDFRQLIRIAIIQNNAGSSLATIDSLLQQFFPGTILVFDYANMQMDYYFKSSAGSQDLAELFVTQKLLPKPMGVQLGALIYAPIIDSFFGFRTYQLEGFNNSPFNSYSSYQSGRPWLSYQNAIVP